LRGKKLREHNRHDFGKNVKHFEAAMFNQSRAVRFQSYGSMKSIRSVDLFKG